MLRQDQWIEAALTDKRLTKHCLKVLIAMIALKYNRKNESFCPSRERISCMTGIHPTHISNAITRLCNYGWINREIRPGRSSRYQFLPSNLSVNLDGAYTFEIFKVRHNEEEEGHE